MKSLRNRKRSLIVVALLSAPPIALALPASPLAAQSQVRFDVPAGRLSSAIRTLSRQAGVSVASSDSGLRQVRSRAVRGQMSTGEALRRLLAGTPYRAVLVRGGAYRIERRPVTRLAPRPAVSARPTPPPPPPPPPQPIIVEASKRAAAPVDYAGGIKVLDLDVPGLRAEVDGLDALLASVPSVNGTALGSGRNKIFLRGIADSSFNGPTQSTIGLYLGEQRVIFSAPNPDLRLVDVEAVELLEGPQGSLYGAGTLAGLLRVNPRAPDPSAFEGAAWASGATTSGGGESWDTGAMLNVPVSDGSALRLVGYGGQEAGYIDRVGPERAENINRARFYGGRAAFGVDLGADWSADLSAFGQHSETRDGQYIDGALTGLQRRDRVAQPFANRIYGGALSLRGYLGDVELISTTGMVDNSLRTTFDSSLLAASNNGAGAGLNVPRQAFRETREIRLITHETRISGGDRETFDWLIGIGALRDRDDINQIFVNLGNADNPPPFARQRFSLDEIALFGEGQYWLSPDWSLTAGARLLYTRSEGQRSFGANTVVEPRNGPARLLPTLALSWRPSSGGIVYARYQQGFRTGGVTIERAQNGDPDTARFDPDRIRSYEIGLRGSAGEAPRISYAASAHHSNWRDIQADLIDAQGFPITRNIGDGTIWGIDANLGLETGSGWRFDLAAALNETNVDRLAPMGQIIRASIPNVPDIAANARLAKEWEWGDDESAGLALSVRYTGRSFLDIDQQVRARQGDFASLDAAVWFETGPFDLRLEALNLTDTQGNRFAFGNPFTARVEDQQTPLRPFTIRAQIRIAH